MFYRPENGHGLPHNPFGAIVAPRPIAWISTQGNGRRNLAPYSFFNAVSYEPPQVMFSSTGVKDTLRNIEATGVFCVNMPGLAQFEAMNATSTAQDVDEFAHAGVASAECAEIDCPRVADAPAALECRLEQLVSLRGGSTMVIGEVVGVHLREDVMRDGRLDARAYTPITRLGYHDYAAITELFAKDRPQ